MSVKFGNKIGFGTMSLTVTSPPVPQEEAFEVLRTAIDNGVDLFDSGEFYGVDPPELNLIYLKEFFEKYPELRSKVKISVKGAFDHVAGKPEGDRKGINKSINNILKYIDYIDIFECARIDPKVPVEESIGYIKEFIELGKVGGISLSEVGAESIKRAAAVYPISFVEVEFSLWTTDILTNGVYEACQKLHIPILAYSPLGKGVLSGKFKTFADLPKEGPLSNWDRYGDEEIFNHNMKLVEKINSFALEKKVAPSQLALAWILKHEGIVPIPGTSKPERVIENLKSAEVELSDSEFKEINDLLNNFEVKGHRYNEKMDSWLI